MSATPGLGLVLIDGGVGGGVLLNEALVVMDIVYGVGVQDILNAAPGSPNENEAWIVGVPTVGDDWYQQDGKIAVWLNSAWRFYDAAQGVRTINNSNNLALMKGSAGWHYATGIAAFFARLSTADVYSGTAAAEVQGWTQMLEQPASNALFDHTDGIVELQEGGVYECRFSGVVVPATAADTYRIGFGLGSATPISGGFADFAFVAADLTAPHAFCIDMIRSFSAGDDLYVCCDKQTAAGGTLTFVDESCKWSIKKLSP